MRPVGLVLFSPGVMYDSIIEEMINVIVKILYYFLFILPDFRRYVLIREGTWAGYYLKINSFAYQSDCVGVSCDLPEDWSLSCRRNVVSNFYFKHG